MYPRTGMSRALRLLAFGCCLLILAACRRYEEFTLPPPGGTPEPVTWQWTVVKEPVIAHGQESDWDGVDALNPSVLIFKNELLSYYSGFDGKTWHTGLATSADGLKWTKQGRILSPDPATWEGSYIAANGHIIYSAGRFLYWYQAGPKGRTQIGLAQSADGRKFTKLPHPVLETGPYGSWDEVSIGDPYVIHIGGYYYLYYLGQDRARRQRLGVARSRDGIEWTKLRSNPVMEIGEPGSFDEQGLGEPALWQSHGYYWMIYTGRDRRERRRMGLARSIDGIRWERQNLVIAGEESWNSHVVCDPTVEVKGNVVRVWFGGGNAASPDENLHGQIGVGMLSAVYAKDVR